MITINNTATTQICFSDIPVILDVEQTSYDGIPAYATISVGTITAGGELTVNGIVFHSVQSHSQEAGRAFWISSDAVSTAMSITRALRREPAIAGSYDVYMEDLSVATVTMRARNASSQWNITMSSTINGLTMSTHASGAAGWGVERIGVDVYGSSRYLSSLEKVVASNITSFDLSPVASSSVDWSGLVPCNANVYGTTPNGLAADLGSLDFWMVKGYAIDGSPMSVDAVGRVAAYLNRGKVLPPGADNSTRLYFNPSSTIDFSWLNLSDQTLEFDVRFLASSLEELVSDTIQFTGLTYPSVSDISIDLSSYMGNDVFYVDVECPDGYVIRYEAIRPERASESVTRLYWRNCMGGVSFFDFTGSYSQKLDMDRKGVTREFYDAYRTEIKGDRLSWNNTVKHSDTLTSHLIESDGTWLFQDLAGARLVWMEHDGMKQYVTVTSVSCDETDVNGVFEAKVGIEY